MKHSSLIAQAHTGTAIYPPPTSPLKGGGSRFDRNLSISDNLFPLLSACRLALAEAQGEG